MAANSTGSLPDTGVGSSYPDGRAMVRARAWMAANTDSNRNMSVGTGNLKEAEPDNHHNQQNSEYFHNPPSAALFSSPDLMSQLLSKVVPEQQKLHRTDRQ